MHTNDATDYETYREIMGELLRPIDGSGLDADTLKRLYESKLVYLENLRLRCFLEINGRESGYFTVDDYQLILRAVSETNRHLRELVLLALNTSLRQRSAAS